MTKDFIGRVLGVALVLLASYLFIAFIKWNLLLVQWSEFERASILLLPLLIGLVRHLLTAKADGGFVR